VKYLAFFDSGIGLAYLSGIFALVLIIATALLVFLKTRLVNRHPSRRDLITKTHIVLATLGGAFLLLHADYFIRAPIFDPWIFLGYLSTAVALVVWFTGFSFIERLRYSLLYRGSLSLFAIALMIIHAVELGLNLPLEITEAILVVLVVVTFVRAMQHVGKILTRKRLEVASH
jgi:hypothetical protein